MAYNNTATQTAALSAVHNEFKDARVEALQAKLAETTLEMERARMAAEDAQGKAMSPSGNNVHTQDPRLRLQTWREFGQ